MKIKSTLNNFTSISNRLTKSNFSYFSNSTNFSQSCVSISPLKTLKTTKNELNHRLPLILGEDGRRGGIEIGIEYPS
ncbi:MAG: hypothetical protein RBS19_11730 [Bacteroidales bacterium]|nr:hypothetical protein [Bacteroidales bacterium]